MNSSLVRIGKIPFVVTTMDEAVRYVLDCAAHEHALPVRFANAWCVVSAEHDSQYSRVFDDGGLTFPDGAPVAWAMRRLAGERAATRVRGPSFFVRAMLESDPETHRHYFIGSTPEVLDRIRIRLGKEAIGVTVAGIWSPPYGPLDADFFEQARSRIIDSNANVIWVGLGTPKQDFAASRIASETGNVCLGVGAAFDFYAGTIPEAPRILQTLGLEWLFRLFSEPRRLWRRYLIGNARFLRIIFAQQARRFARRE